MSGRLSHPTAVFSVLGDNHASTRQHDRTQALEATIRDLLAWVDTHRAGRGFDCVQARDVAAIIERGAP